jgi:HlyD family secretion protein
MSSDGIFRARAIERLSTPEQLDQLVGITRPADWAALIVIVLGLAALGAWSVAGRIPTYVGGEGILISDGGRVVDAVSAASGRLASIEVNIGDRVTRGQVIARIDQTEMQQRFRDATEVLREREREDAELAAAIEGELAAKADSFLARKAGLEQSIAAAEQRAAFLSGYIADLESLKSRGFVTRRDLEERRAELHDTQQRITDAHNEIQRLLAEKQDLETQRQRDRLASSFGVNEARRAVEQLSGALERDSALVSPIDGQVIELKVSAGSVLAIGMPVVAIETEGKTLEAMIYIPPDRGKEVQVGMEARVEPAAAKREEFGTLIGKVASISEFPMSAQGMAAALHNEALAARFAHEGAPYAAVVELERDDGAPSGYRWSSGTGPPLRLSTGTLARAEITTREQPPLDLVMPIVRRLSGTGR